MLGLERYLSVFILNGHDMRQPGLPGPAGQGGPAVPRPHRHQQADGAPQHRGVAPHRPGLRLLQRHGGVQLRLRGQRGGGAGDSPEVQEVSAGQRQRSQSEQRGHSDAGPQSDGRYLEILMLGNKYINYTYLTPITFIFLFNLKTCRGQPSYRM